MTDRIVDLLVGFEERFDRNGHNTNIDVTDIGEPPFTLVCLLCEQVAVVDIVNKHGAWTLPTTRLDLPCPNVIPT